MPLLYRILMRLATVVFVGTAGSLGIFMIANVRETTWSEVQWWLIAVVLFGPAGVITALAWVVKPPPSPPQPTHPNATDQTR